MGVGGEALDRQHSLSFDPWSLIFSLCQTDQCLTGAANGTVTESVLRPATPARLPVFAEG